MGDKQIRIGSKEVEQSGEGGRYEARGPLDSAARARNSDRQNSDRRDAFEQFSASQLFCPKCNTAMPVRERLLLVLATGKLYDLTCVRCHTSLGTRTA